MLSLSEHNNAKSTEILDAHGCCVVAVVYVVVVVDICC